MKKIGIIDLKSGNLNSLENAISAVGYSSEIITKPSKDIDVLFLPGQGRFRFISEGLNQNNWRPFLQEWYQEQQKLIGICVGMQIFFEGSDEDPGFNGLKLLTGKVSPLSHPKTPMIGWAQLQSDNKSLNQQYAYFVNSYAVKNSEFCTAKTIYGDSFVASVRKDNLYGFQFHPEKSGQFGREVIQSCLQ